MRFNETYIGLARLIVLTAMMLVLAIFKGMWQTIRAKRVDSIPIWLTLFSVACAHFAYRFVNTYVPNQDFRFSVLAVIPLTYFCTVGIMTLPPRVRLLSFFIAIQFAFLCSAFFALVFFTSST
jgi:hypothetical protein